MRQIVHKVEPGMDRHEISATTYQMRNFYRQLGSGFYTVLDVMNYIQHEQVVRWARNGQQVLDICCGRGLLLPLLRYQRPKLGGYTGVDIAPKNAVWTHQRVTDSQEIAEGYWPFPVRFVEANVASMAEPLGQTYDLLVYTSSIEHMHHDDGLASLEQARRCAAPGAGLILTCPNTPEGQDGYDTQYAAHVYEWKRSELEAALAATGWAKRAEWGLLLSAKALRTEMARTGQLALLEVIASFVPSEWYVPVLSIPFPRQAREIGLLAKAV